MVLGGSNSNKGTQYARNGEEMGAVSPSIEEENTLSVGKKAAGSVKVAGETNAHRSNVLERAALSPPPRGQRDNAFHQNAHD